MASVSKRAWEHNGVRKEAWSVRYLDTGGVRRRRTFTAKKEADAFKRKVENELADGTHLARTASGTVEEVCEDFLKREEDRWRDGRIGQSHQRHMKMTINARVLPFFGHRIISELTVSDIEAWYRDMLRGSKPISPMSAKTMVQRFKLVEVYAVKRGLLKTTPIADYIKELRGVRHPEVRVFTMDEIRRLHRALESRAPFQWRRTEDLLRCMVYLASFCGLRYGEIMGLKRSNIDFQGRMIRVRHSLTDWDELKGPKTASGKRDVPMPSMVARAIMTWIDNGHLRENDRDLLFRSSGFRGAVDGRIKATDFHAQWWTPLLRRAGIVERDTQGRRLRFHALRHFAGSWMIANDFPLTDVAVILGHKKFDMTLQVYAHQIVGAHSNHNALETASLRLLQPPLNMIEGQVSASHGPRETQNSVSA